ncbi:hypothetical protein [Nereida sp. MMG025]|uniref:hypothetical protein n=1 Tax=Nereida sp. MMG025 TaxID=2909981 RepID=UPI001F2B7D29|nr:hypothetical protein [Nereida sp. MMG025]MCF6446109.1 hypothetical protein [Nereida sp. MMG025]
MYYLIKKLLPSVAVALAVTGLSLPTPARAQTYPIDCAILLCLSGGWPASVPCARARAEFIRRITPWPVEPPLQIWRCPMGASYESDQVPNSAGRIFEAFYQTETHQSLQSLRGSDFVPSDHPFQLVQDRADIDISGSEFDFVRSIRVFDVRYAQQRESDRDGECNRRISIYRGTYGEQGDFTWQNSTISNLPTAHVGLENWGKHCPRIGHRSVFVDWLASNKNYGYEQVNY